MKNEPISQDSEKTEQNRTFAKRVGRFFSATLISRVLGYARDALVAYVFGGSALTDAFYTAFRASNLLRRLLGEGALASSFVPVFAKSVKDEPREEVQKFLNAMFTSLMVVLIVIVALGIWFAPYLTNIIAPGFKDSPEKFALTVSLTRWIFPFFLFIALAALMTGVLNGLKHFFLPAVAPAMLSVSEIAYLLFFVKHFAPDAQIIGLAVSVVVGGALHFAIQLPALYKEKFKVGFRWDWKHPHSVQVGKLMLPAVLGLSVDQINAFVDTILATFLVHGSVTALYNSNRLMQLPLALFGISIASVSLPTMSDHSADQDYHKFAETVNLALRMVVFMVLPATAGLIFLSRPIVRILFEHGEFTPFATELTSLSLIGYAIGLIAYSSAKVLANAFYSLQEPKVPVKNAAICMPINVALCTALMIPWGVFGLALGTSLTSWFNAGWLYHKLKKRVREHASIKLGETGGNISVTFFKTLLASSFMIGFLLAMEKFGSALPTAVKVAVGVLGGVGIFMAAARLLKMQEQKLAFRMIGIKDEPED